jgi:hypothetical protein
LASASFQLDFNSKVDIKKTVFEIQNESHTFFSSVKFVLKTDKISTCATPHLAGGACTQGSSRNQAVTADVEGAPHSQASWHHFLPSRSYS